MQDVYLNIFEDMFCDVNIDLNIKNNLEQASGLFESLIIKFGGITSELCNRISQDNKYTDFVVNLFSRKIMEQLDAINLLFSVGSFFQVQILLQTFIEKILSLIFILEKDTEMRAGAFFLEHHYQEIRLYEEMIKGGSNALDDEIKDKMRSKSEFFSKLVQNSSQLKKIDDIRKKQIAQNGSTHWYEVCSDVKNLRDLIDNIGYGDLCNEIFGEVLNKTHMYNSMQGLNIVNDEICLEKIRRPVGGKISFEFVCKFSLLALRKIYEYLEADSELIADLDYFIEDFLKKREIVCNNLQQIR